MLCPLVRILAPLLGVALVLAGCGGERPSRSGSSLVRAINYGDPGNLDPIVKSDVAAQMVTMHIFSRLLSYDPVARKLDGDLAESWKVSPDNKAYTFTLRQGPTFHNGRKLTAADVKYSFERLVDPKSASPSANALIDVSGARDFREGRASEIGGIKVEGDSQVSITLETVRPTFPMTLTSVPLSIVPKEEVEKAGADFGKNPVGSGPFMLEAYRADDRVVLEANPNYFGGRPRLDAVIFRIMKEEATRDAEFRTENLDMLTAGDANYGRYRDDPRYRDDIIEVPELFTRAIFFNVRKKPFDDVRVRQAVNYAVDKKVVVEKVLRGKAYPAIGPLQRSSPAFNKDLEGYRYDPARARQLLKEAGLEGGFEMEVVATESGARVLEGFAGFLKDIGISLRVVQLESATVLERARSGDFTAVYFSTGGDVDPVGFLDARLHSRNAGRAGNVSLYSNPEVDSLLDEAQSITDEARRIELARRVEKIVVADAPWFFFNYNKAVIVHQPWVRGLQAVPTDIDFQDLTKVWVTEKK